MSGRNGVAGREKKITPRAGGAWVNGGMCWFRCRCESEPLADPLHARPGREPNRFRRRSDGFSGGAQVRSLTQHTDYIGIQRRSQSQRTQIMMLRLRIMTLYGRLKPRLHKAQSPLRGPNRTSFITGTPGSKDTKTLVNSAKAGLAPSLLRFNRPAPVMK